MRERKREQRNRGEKYKKNRGNEEDKERAERNRFFFT